MNTTMRLAAALATGAGLIAVAAAPVSAGTASGSTPLGTATVTVPNTTWTSYDCQEIPVTATVTGTRDSDVDWDITVDARRSGSGSINSWAWLWGSGDGSDADSFLLCPYEGSGLYTVTGEVEFLDWDTWAEGSAALATSFTMSKMTSTTKITEVRKTRSGTKVTGTVKARSATLGSIGAQGRVVVKAKKPGGTWTKVGATYANDRGAYVVSTWRKYPAGTRFKALYRGDQVTKADPSPVWR